MKYAQMIIIVYVAKITNPASNAPIRLFHRGRENVSPDCNIRTFCLYPSFPNPVKRLDVFSSSFYAVYDRGRSVSSEEYSIRSKSFLIRTHQNIHYEKPEGLCHLYFFLIVFGYPFRFMDTVARSIEQKNSRGYVTELKDSLILQ